jgi:hypothetical protein
MIGVVSEIICFERLNLFVSIRGLIVIRTRSATFC